MQATHVEASNSTSKLKSYFDNLSQHRIQQENRKTVALPEVAPANLDDYFQQMKTFRAHAIQRGEMFNVWQLMKLKRDEVRTCEILQWLFDPNGSHGLGNSVWKSLLSILAARKTLPVGFAETLDSEYSVQTEYCSFGDRSDRVDLVLRGTTWIAFIEVKIDAIDQPFQLQRYAGKLEEKARAFGKKQAHLFYLSIRKPPPLGGVSHIRWRDIGASIRAALEERSDRDQALNHTLIQFSEHVESF